MDRIDDWIPDTKAPSDAFTEEIDQMQDIVDKIKDSIPQLVYGHYKGKIAEDIQVELFKLRTITANLILEKYK